MTRIKICGCMRAADAVAAADAGADFIGILFADSRRRVSAEEAAIIVRAAGTPVREIEQSEPPPMRPPGGAGDSIDAWFRQAADALSRLLERKRPLTVGVFEDQPIDEVNEIAERAGIDLIQFSGGEPWSDCMLATRQAVKVLRPRAGMTAADILAQIEPGFALAAMLDGSRGTGTAADLAIAAEVAQRLPLWLAGGLAPANVGAVIARVRPWCVDVSSGVETDGAKDAAKIAAFAQAVQAADKEMAHA
ncbi:MAG: phosphoribosylanthranilate isomerase [Chloroflexi bacterium]|nr:phosphoribosylanthranilate isomerase [Chloroflexota bacterium]